MSREHLTDVEMIVRAIRETGEALVEATLKATEALTAILPALAQAARDEEPSEADLIRYYHHEGGEDPVTRQQLRDAGRPGL